MPSQVVQVPVGRGAATGIDPSLAQKLQTAEGVVYRPGDPAAHKFPGRVAFNAAPVTSSNQRGVAFAHNRLMAFYGDVAHISATPGVTGSFITNFTGDFTTVPDVTTLFDKTYLASGTRVQNGTGPYGAYELGGILGLSDIRLGMYPVRANPSVALGAGGNIDNGDYFYWITEYDAVNQIESAFGLDDDLTGSFIAVTLDQVTITLPGTAANSSATHFRVYRTVAGGSFPIGWLVDQVIVGTATVTDDLPNDELVLNEPYRIVTINGIPESMDGDPQNIAIGSITSFQGSLVGTISSGGDMAFTPAAEPHSWPFSYRITMPTIYGSSSTCVRACGDVCYLAFPQELFLINYLPDESDAVYDPNICVEKVASYGTPSPHGMCLASASLGPPFLFMASLQGPMLVMGRVVDRAVKNIDWANTVQLGGGRPATWKAIDNPEKQRIEFFYQNETSASSGWKSLHFYYDTERTVRETGPLPELAWTGPHDVPGPGTFGLHSTYTSASWTAGSGGTVYTEGQGTSDAANLVDADGTINFRLRTQRVYPAGPTGEATTDRLFISKQGSGEQDYTCTLNRWRERFGEVQVHSTTNIVIAGEHDGINSHTLNDSVQGFDVEVNADGNVAMAPINNISVVLRDTHQGIKTVTV